MVQELKIRIELEQINALRQYKEVTGVSISHAVEEALSDYIEAVIPARLEALSKAGRKTGQSHGETEASVLLPNKKTA